MIRVGDLIQQTEQTRRFFVVAMDVGIVDVLECASDFCERVGDLFLAVSAVPERRLLLAPLPQISDEGVWQLSHQPSGRRDPDAVTAVPRSDALTAWRAAGVIVIWIMAVNGRMAALFLKRVRPCRQAEASTLSFRIVRLTKGEGRCLAVTEATGAPWQSAPRFTAGHMFRHPDRPAASPNASPYGLEGQGRGAIMPCAVTCQPAKL